jgi:hypothetical protein
LVDGFEGKKYENGEEKQGKYERGRMKERGKSEA